MCTLSQRNAFVNVLFTLLVIFNHFIPGNTVDAFQRSGCEPGLFLHVNPATRARVCCIPVPLPKGYEFVSCDVNGGYDRIAKCPDGLFQVDNTTTASEAVCSREIECNPDENLKIPDCDTQGHCTFSCICNCDKGYCGLNFYDCQSFPPDCPRRWVQQDCTCKWKPTASTSSALGNATNKSLQKITTTPSKLDGKSKTTEKKDRTLTGEEDQVLLTIRNNETGLIPDQKQMGFQHYTVIIVLSVVVILAFIIVLAVYCWKSKRNRKYQSVAQHNDYSSNHDGGSRSDTDNRPPDDATIPQPPDKSIGDSHNGAVHGDGGTVIGSRERLVATVRPQRNITDHVRFISEPSTADDRNQISISALTMEGYSEFTQSLLDNADAPPNEETVVLNLDNQQEQDDVSSEQQSSDETHTKELHQLAINNMEDDVPEDVSLYSQFSSGIYQ